NTAPSSKPRASASCAAIPPVRRWTCSKAKPGSARPSPSRVGSHACGRALARGARDFSRVPAVERLDSGGKRMNDTSRELQDQASVLDEIRESGATKVKVAVADIDGILRGKYMHRDKFFSAVEGGFGFCDVAFGWDIGDQPYDNAHLTGWHLGFPDASVRLDLATYRRVPWDSDVPFFLGNVVKADGSPYPLCPRQVLRRVLKRAEKLGFQAMIGCEFEFFNFAETPQSWAAKKGVDPTPISSGMCGYSLLRAGLNREYFNALMDELARFRVPIEGLHT